jgi:Lon protease-like protein
MSARLRLFPLNAVLFPGAALKLHVFEPRYKQMIGECLETGEGFGVVLIREGKETGDPTVEPHQIGCIAEIVEAVRLPFGRYYISAVGRRRFRILEIISRAPYLTVEAEVLEEAPHDAAQVVELHERVREAFLRYLELLSQFTNDPPNVDLPPDAQSASYVIADALQILDTLKQRLLETTSTKQRLTTELALLRRLLPQMRKLLKQRDEELQARGGQAEEDPQRTGQEKYFGKYFSSN